MFINSISLFFFHYLLSLLRSSINQSLV